MKCDISEKKNFCALFKEITHVDWAYWCDVRTRTGRRPSPAERRSQTISPCWFSVTWQVSNPCHLVAVTLVRPKMCQPLSYLVNTRFVSSVWKAIITWPHLLAICILTLKIRVTGSVSFCSEQYLSRGKRHSDRFCKNLMFPCNKICELIWRSSGMAVVFGSFIYCSGQLFDWCLTSHSWILHSYNGSHECGGRKTGRTRGGVGVGGHDHLQVAVRPERKPPRAGHEIKGTQERNLQLPI